MNIQLVVFDIAGTTLKDEEDVVANCFTKALSNHGIDISAEEMNRVMGYRKIDAIKMVLDDKAIEVREEKVQAIHDEFLELINKHYTEAPIEEIDGASSLFKSLKEKGIKIAINTGFSRSTTDIIIDRMGWKENGLIDTSATSDEVNQGRPSADMINKIMAELDITDIKSVAKVGDTPSDLMEGTNAGCAITVGVLYGTHTKEELIDYPHDYLISDISELNEILTKA